MTDPITTILAMAAEIYDRDVSPILMSAWRSVLAGIPEIDLVAAFQAHLSDPRAGAFFPKPADILRHMRARAEIVAEREFGSLMDAACFGGVADVSPAARQTFIAVTGGAGNFDMRRWDYLRWDGVRTKYLHAACAMGDRPDNSAARIEHDAHQLEDPR